MSKEIVGSTHAAHEVRHLEEKMKAVRNGKKDKEEIRVLISKIEKERYELTEKYADCCSFLGINNNLQLDVPRLSIEQADKYVYMDGLEPMDFLFVSKLETYYQYGTPAPQKEHLRTGTMLLQACINELTWALGELNAHTTK